MMFLDKCAEQSQTLVLGSGWDAVPGSRIDLLMEKKVDTGLKASV